MERNILLVGAPGTGKTHAAKKMAEEITGDIDGKSGSWELVSFHPSLSYQDFIKGIQIEADEQISYKNVDRIFLEMCKRADTSGKPHVLILDDVHRADISAVFGELLYALEYRGEEISIASNGNQSEKICVPDNLYVIATYSRFGQGQEMDYALMRRFEVRHMSSNSQILRQALDTFDLKQEECDEIVSIYESVNEYVSTSVRDKEEFRQSFSLGHTYFLPANNRNPVIQVKKKICNQMIPLLIQYKKDGIFDESFQVEALQKKYYTEYADDYEICEATDTIISWNIRISKVILPDNKEISVSGELNLSGLDIAKGYIKAYCGYIKAYCDNIQDIKAANVYRHKITLDDFYKRFRPDNSVDNKWKSKLENACNQDMKHPIYFKLSCYQSELINIIIAEMLRQGLIDNTTFYNQIMLNKDVLVYNHQGKQYRLYGMVKDRAYVEKSKPIYNQNDYSYFDVNGQRLRCLSPSSSPRDDFDTANFEENNRSGIVSMQRYSDIYRIIMAYYDLYEAMYEEYSGIRIDTENVIFKKAIKSICKDKKKIKVVDFVTQLLKIDMLNMKNDHEELKGVYRIMDKDYKSIMDDLNIRQMILQGPPGTSKTYGAKEYLLNLILGSDGNLLSEDKNKDILARHQIQDYNNDPEIDTSSGERKIFWDIVQFHPSYSYEDFVRGIEVGTEDTKTVSYRTVNKILGKMAKLANEAYKNPDNFEGEKYAGPEFFLIIDEINRANMATVFGELIYALEYRNTEVATPYAVKENNKNEANKICIPSNMYIIGTMNTADKSIGGMDYAIRRRFLFFPMLPNKQLVEDNAKKIQAKGDGTNLISYKLFVEVEKLFEKNGYLEEDYYKDDVQIGHSYFLMEQGATEEKVNKLMFRRLQYQIIPIIREYYKDGILKRMEDSEMHWNEGLEKPLKELDMNDLMMLSMLADEFVWDDTNQKITHIAE